MMSEPVKIAKLRKRAKIVRFFFLKKKFLITPLKFLKRYAILSKMATFDRMKVVEG